MFWNRFYSLCIQNNTKPLNVATNLHFSSGSITKWKKGSVPSGETLLKIANYFNVSIDYLLGNDNANSVFTEREASYAESDVNVLTVSEPVSENKLELIDLIKAAELSDQQISIIKSLIDSYNK